MLKQSSVQKLRGEKNLLAFSAGGDSTALFFLLQEQNINFDIAIVDYNIREQSKQEVAYAQELAQKYNLTCHLFNAPSISTNFESQARKIRYDFFEELIENHNYNNLLTGHHLGDRFEWMLMQFCKGAGCVELSGMSEVQLRQNYTLVRPLLDLDKAELLEYLRLNTIKYFEDETNLDQNIKRNSFRHFHTQPLLEKYSVGIKKSFKYLDEDKKILVQDIKIISSKELSYFKSSLSIRADIIAIDKHLKTLSYLLSASERELLKHEKTIVVGRKFVVNQEHTYVFIIPFKRKQITMSKEFKERCRILKIDTKLRPYLYENKETFLEIQKLLN